MTVTVLPGTSIESPRTVTVQKPSQTLGTTKHNRIDSQAQQQQMPNPQRSRDVIAIWGPNFVGLGLPEPSC